MNTKDIDMSLGINFNYLDSIGKIVAKECRLIATSNYDNYENLTWIRNESMMAWRHPMHCVRKEVRYIVPTHIPDYMIDIENGQILPNSFK